MFSVLHRIKNYFAREAARKAKLNALFQPGNMICTAQTGKVYEVLSVEMCYAFIKSADGRRHVVDWLTPAGTIRTEVADNWNFVAA